MRWPNLFLVGVAKAGTSSLHSWLDQHPDISMSRTKEPHFFTENIYDTSNNHQHSQVIRNEEDYFDIFENDKDYGFFGESSPSYFWESDTAEKIKKISPNAHVIIILRDPISRAFSHYHMDFRSGRETAPSFQEALENDMKRNPKGWGKSRLYLELGLYSQSLKHFKKHFPENQLHVLFYETFFSDIQKSLNELFIQLNLTSYPVVISNSKNTGYYYQGVGKYLRKSSIQQFAPKPIRQMAKRFLTTDEKPPIAIESKEFLMDYYRDDLISLDKDLQIEFYTNFYREQHQIDLMANA